MASLLLLHLCLLGVVLLLGRGSWATPSAPLPRPLFLGFFDVRCLSFVSVGLHVIVDTQLRLVVRSIGALALGVGAASRVASSIGENIFQECYEST